MRSSLTKVLHLLDFLPSLFFAQKEAPRDCCGAGVSSGFLAQRMRAEARERKLDIRVEACTEFQAECYLDQTDILLLGPHFSGLLPYYQDLEKLHYFKAAVIPTKIYGTVDAKGMLELIRRMREEETGNGE